MRSLYTTASAALLALTLSVAAIAPAEAGPVSRNAARGALTGAAIGGIVDGGRGAARGAVIGGATGAIVGAAKKDRRRRMRRDAYGCRRCR